jgi:hypothetical protein
MLKQIYRYLLLITLLVLSLATSVWAIPNLQIYIPGAEYDTATETWIINSYNYELWVIGAHLNVRDVKIALAVPVPTDENGSISVKWLEGSLLGNPSTQPGYSEVLNENYAGFYPWGTPTMGDGDPLPPHGVFPTSVL